VHTSNTCNMHSSISTRRLKLHIQKSWSKQASRSSHLYKFKIQDYNLFYFTKSGRLCSEQWCIAALWLVVNSAVYKYAYLLNKVVLHRKRLRKRVCFFIYTHNDLQRDQHTSKNSKCSCYKKLVKLKTLRIGFFYIYNTITIFVIQLMK